MTGVFTALGRQRRPATLLSVLAACVCLSAGTAHAQVLGDPLTLDAEAGVVRPPVEVATTPVAAGLPPSTRLWRTSQPSLAHSELRQSLQLSIIEHGKNATPFLQRQAQGVQPVPARRERSGWRRFAGGAVGAFGGFFAGGYLGAAIDGDCGGCDDPGLKGALIGAPIGAVLGGIAGALWLF